MSTIAAGTTSGTALVTSGDTTGQLVFQTNGTTTALTIGTNQVATFAGAISAPSMTLSSGALPVSSGGTGSTSLTANNVLLGNGTSAVQVVAPGTAGNVLTSNGTTWQSTAPAPSAGSITATASGAISIGNSVVINSDGTVSAVTATANTSTWSTLSSGTDSTANNAWTGTPAFSYDPSTGIIVMWYRRSSVSTLAAKAFRFNASGTLQVGAMTDTGFGLSSNPQAVGCTNAGGTFTHVGIMIDNGGSDNLWAHSATVNPTTLAVNVMANTFITNVTSGPIAVGCHQALNRIATVAYYGNTGNYTLHNLKVNSNGTLSDDGNDLSLSASSVNTNLFVYESTQQRLVFISTPNSNSFYPTAYVLNFSGTGSSTMSFASNSTVFAASPPGGVLTASAIGSSQISVFSTTSGGTGRFNIGTISGSTISFGGFNNTGLTGYGTSSSIALTGTSSYAVQSGGFYQTFTLSGSTATFGSVLSLPNTTTNNVWYLSAAGEVNNFVFGSSPTVSYYALSPYSTNINASNFIGFSAGTYANAATATVNVVGSTNNNQSGLTAGTKYYAGVTGSLNTTTTNPYAGVALSSTRILVKG